MQLSFQIRFDHIQQTSFFFIKEIPNYAQYIE